MRFKKTVSLLFTAEVDLVFILFYPEMHQSKTAVKCNLTATVRPQNNAGVSKPPLTSTGTNNNITNLYLFFL